MKRKKNIPTLKKLLTIAALGLTATAAYTQSYDEILRLRGMNETVQGIRSMADGEHYTVLEGSNVRRYDYAGREEGRALLPVVSGDFRIHDYLFSPDEQSMLLSVGATPIYRHSYTTSCLLYTSPSPRDM